jgi:predicted phosphodiesterase
MNIQLLSDLHVEFDGFAPEKTDADMVVLAGDIHVDGETMQWALESFDKPVILVLGNHDYYQASLAATLDKFKKMSKGTNVTLLQNESVEVCGVRFLGATLWTDYRLTGNEPLARLDAGRIMSDFECIKDERGGWIDPQRIAQEHAASRSWLTNTLKEAYDGKTVVVTHHAPSELSIHEKYVENTGHTNAAYASRLDALMGPGVDLWVHGHTHHSFDYDLYGTRVVCNPRGYSPNGLNKDFNPALVLSLDVHKPKSALGY